MVPKGWSVKNLENICKMQAGKFVKANDIFNDQAINTYPCFGGNGLRGYTETFTHDGLFSLIGRQGALCGNIKLASNKFHATEHAVVTTPFENIDKMWLYYTLIDLNLNKYATGQAQPGLSVKNLENIPVLTPDSFYEQQKIAKTLSTWDEAISTTERLIENSTQQKKALMQQLLTGKKRLLDDSGKRFEGDWKDVKLSAVVKVTGGNAFKSTDFKEAGIPLIKISNIKSDYSVSIDPSVFISLDQKYDKFQIKNGDVLIAMSGATTGKIGKYTFDEIAYLNQRVGRFDVRKGLTIKSYIFQLLKLPKVQHEILIDAVGGAQPNISNKDIERIKVLIPPLKEQQKIATVLSTADKEIELLEQQLDDLQQEKKALMQVLLTGKKRVVVDS